MVVTAPTMRLTPSLLSGPDLGVQSERKLCCTRQFGQVGHVVERLAAFGEYDLGGGRGRSSAQLCEQYAG